jgi:5-methylcytosine-specific restriction endonuclease McrA
MKICPKCGCELPYSSFYKDKNRKDGYNVWCKTCIGIAKRRWAAQEHIVQRRRLQDIEYYNKNKARIKENKKRYAKKNKEKISEYNKWYYATYKGYHRRRVQLWRQSERGKECIKNMNTLRRCIYKYNQGISRKEWELVCNYYENKCYYCGRSDVKLTMDHIIPLSKGGVHTPYNIVPSCQSCNSKKKDSILGIGIQVPLVV